VATAGRHYRRDLIKRSGFDDLSMSGATERVAVYTTIYPGVEKYLPDWYRSVQAQTDQDFQLWMGIDAVEKGTIESLLGPDLKVKSVVARPGATPAQVRDEALACIVDAFSEVVLVDSDDLLYPSRVSSARAALQASEIAGCALRLVDQEGNDLGQTFDLPPQLEPEAIFPRNNVFGFSNSAFRSDLLRRCLPIPPQAILVDWYLATRAWLLGASMAFDHVPRMKYRQYPSNTARLRLPFSSDQIVSDTELVQQHFQIQLAGPKEDCIAQRYDELRSVAAEIDQFHRRVVLNPTRLHDYTETLNALAPALLWWSSVANPELTHLWAH
jgi:hypothetical protein